MGAVRRGALGTRVLTPRCAGMTYYPVHRPGRGWGGAFLLVHFLLQHFLYQISETKLKTACLGAIS